MYMYIITIIIMVNRGDISGPKLKLVTSFMVIKWSDTQEEHC